MQCNKIQYNTIPYDIHSSVVYRKYWDRVLDNHLWTQYRGIETVSPTSHTTVHSTLYAPLDTPTMYALNPRGFTPYLSHVILRKIFKMAENVNNRHYGNFSIFSKFLFKYQFMFYDDTISNL